MLTQAVARLEGWVRVVRGRIVDIMSAIHMLIRRVRERLGQDVKLFISYPRNSMIRVLYGIYREANVEFRPR
jgi:hypothetical protein